MKITENEINSAVRRFFRLNGFSFMSTLPGGEKLYYTINNNPLHNKQPDSIVYKGDLLILCEDKINYSDLFKQNKEHLSDYNKLLSFLTSEEDVRRFNIRAKSGHPDIDFTIRGCLSSLAPKSKRDHTVDYGLFLNVQVSFLDTQNCKAKVICHSDLAPYFPSNELNIKL